MAQGEVTFNCTARVSNKFLFRKVPLFRYILRILWNAIFPPDYTNVKYRQSCGTGTFPRETLIVLLIYR